MVKTDGKELTTAEQNVSRGGLIWTEIWLHHMSTEIEIHLLVYCCTIPVIPEHHRYSLPKQYIKCTWECIVKCGQHSLSRCFDFDLIIDP